MSRLRWMASAAVIVALTGCTGPKDTALPHIAKARDRLARHEDTAALAELKAAVKADPRSKEAYLLTANLYEQTGDLAAAFEAYSRADVLDSGDHTARFRIIDLLLQANNLDAASGRISATIGDDPGNIRALGLRALVEARQGATTKARTDAANVLAKSPNQGDALGALAELALRDTKFDQAQGFVAQGLAADPANEILLQISARIALLQKSPDRAIAIWRGFVDRRPLSPDARATLAALQASTAAVDAGTKTLEEGVGMAPQSRAMRLGLAAYLIQSGQAEAAERALRAAVTAMPQDGTFDLMLAGQQGDHGNLDGAIATVKSAIARVPDSAKVGLQVGLARLFVAKADVENARQTLDEIVAAHPNEDAALMTRSELRLRASEDPAAILADLLAVAKRQPSNAMAFELLARTYLRLHQNDNAIDALRRVADLAPGDPTPSLRVAQLCLQLGRAADAKTAIDTLVRRNPGSTTAQVAAIRFALDRKDLGSAEAGLARLKQLPDSAATSLEIEAEIKEAAGDAKGAAALYQRRLGLAVPDSGLAARGYAQNAFGAGQGAEALDVLSAFAARTTGGEAAAALLAEASVATALGRQGVADAAVASAMRLAPTEAAVYRQAAAGLWKKGQSAAALVQLDQGIAAGADKATLLLTKATLQQAGRDIDGAVASYRAILAINPSSVVAANNLTSLLADQRPLDAAGLTKARDALRGLADTDNLSIVDTIAWADYRLGAFGDAKALFERSNAQNSKDAQIRFHYGAVLIATGAKDAGRQILRTVLTDTFPARDEAEALLTQ